MLIIVIIIICRTASCSQPSERHQSHPLLFSPQIRSKAKMMEKLKSPPPPSTPEQQDPLPPDSPPPFPSPASGGDEIEVTPIPTSPTSPSPQTKESPAPESPLMPLPHNVPVISLGHSKPPSHADVPTTQLTALHPIPSLLQLSGLSSHPPPPSMPLAGVRSPLLHPQYQHHPFLNR